MIKIKFLFITISLLLIFSSNITISQEDSTPPELVNLEIMPLEVDTTTGSATISVRIEAKDDISGFGSGSTGSGSIRIESPSGQPVGRGISPITGGTVLEPIFEFEIEFPQFSEPGTWEVSLTLIDNVFNTVRFEAEDLANLGFPSTVEVTSIEDSTPPELVNLEIMPLEVDTTTGSATISVRIEAKDDISGFGSGSTGSGSIRIESPSGQPVGREISPITGGTVLEPIFEFEIEFPQFSEPGTWEVSLTLIDNVFNTVRFEAEDLANLGFPSTVEVTSIEDSTLPELVNLEVAPLIVNTVNGSSTICVRIEARDDISGFGSGSTGSGSIRIESPSGQPVGRGISPITDGTDLEPVFEFEMDFPQFSDLGIWEISLTLIDNVFNTSRFEAGDLANLGFPSTIEVTTDALPSPEPCFPTASPPPTMPPPTTPPPTPAVTIIPPPTTPVPTLTPSPSTSPTPTSTPTPSPAPTASPDPDDMNNDGVPDANQDNVETIELEDGALTIETDDETTIMNFMLADDLINQNPLPPVNVDFLGILFSFEITNIDIGGSTQARIIFENPVDFDVYYKFGSTPNNPVPHWYEFNYNGETGAERLPNGNVILHFVDGKRGDNDLTQNGRIVDPGGPAVFRNQQPQGEIGNDGGGCSLSVKSNVAQSIFNLLLVFVPVLFLLLVRIAKNRLFADIEE